MGLDLVCGDHRVKAGSYSSVLQQWTALLRVYIIFLRESTPKNLSNDMDVALQRVENRRLATQLEQCLDSCCHSYNEDKLRRLSGRMYAGIRYLLLETHCTGSWDPYQAREILWALGTLKPFFSRVSELSYHVNDRNNEYFLEPVLRTSVRQCEPVMFI